MSEELVDNLVTIFLKSFFIDNWRLWLWLLVIILAVTFIERTINRWLKKGTNRKKY